MPIVKALFLDRDGVINIDKHHLYKIEECEFVPSILDICRYAVQKGYRIFVVTNQAGLAKGYYTQLDMEKLHEYIAKEFKNQGIIIDRFYHCPHHPNFTGECDCRKPEPGLILQAARDFDIDLRNSILIGDKISDILAGKSAGVGTCYLLSGSENPEHHNQKTFVSLTDILAVMKSKED